MSPTAMMISSDSHIIEPPDLWTERATGPMAERVPQVRREPGGDWWYIDGQRSMSFLGFQAGNRFDQDPTKLRIEASFDEVRPGAYDPEKFIADNRTDGVAASVIYPSEALLAYSIPDSELCSTTMALYNDFIAEFCAHDPERLKGIALINLDDIDEAIAEMTRCRNMGLSGAMVSVMPPAGQGYDSPRYEPFWSAAVDLDVPLSMHVATGRHLASASGQTKNDVRGGGSQWSEAAFYLQDHFVRKSLGEDDLRRGVRAPSQAAGGIGRARGGVDPVSGCSRWTTATPTGRCGATGIASPIPTPAPSHYFSSNCFVSFQEDAVGVRVRDTFGTHTLMWGSDYPHTESTFPRSREVVAETLADVPDDEQQQIVRDKLRRPLRLQPRRS